MSNPRYANGNRRRKVRRRVLLEETDCWICGEPVDKTLGKMLGVHSSRCGGSDCDGCVPHPMSPEVDEVVPVSLGGDPFDRANCRLSHRLCNVRRGNGTRPAKRRAKPLETTRRW